MIIKDGHLTTVFWRKLSRPIPNGGRHLALGNRASSHVFNEETFDSGHDVVQDRFVSKRPVPN